MTRSPVWVLGDSILDHNRFVMHRRPSPEEPTCPVCDSEREEWVLGGAANVARWLSGLGTCRPVTLHSHWPRRDPHGQKFMECLTAVGIHPGGFLEVRDGRGTLKERITIQFEDETLPRQQVVRIDSDSDITTSDAEVTILMDGLGTHVNCLDRPAAIVVADYGKGVFQGAGIRLPDCLANFCSEYQIPLLVNSKYPENWADCKADFLICNRNEFQRLDQGGGLATMKVAARHLVITCAENGVLAYVFGGAAWAFERVNQESLCHVVTDVTGAGDAFLAGLASRLVMSGFRRGTVLDPAGLAAATLAGQQAAAVCCHQWGCGEPAWSVEFGVRNE